MRRVDNIIYCITHMHAPFLSSHFYTDTGEIAGLNVQLFTIAQFMSLLALQSLQSHHLSLKERTPKKPCFCSCEKKKAFLIPTGGGRDEEVRKQDKRQQRVKGVGMPKGQIAGSVVDIDQSVHLSLSSILHFSIQDDLTLKTEKNKGSHPYQHNTVTLADPSTQQLHEK